MAGIKKNGAIRYELANQYLDKRNFKKQKAAAHRPQLFAANGDFL